MYSNEVFYYQLPLPTDAADVNHNADFSASSIRVYWEAPKDSIIVRFGMVLGDNSTSQAASYTLSYGGIAANNSFKLGVTNKSGVLVLDIGYEKQTTITQTGLLARCCTSFLPFFLGSTTATNNEIMFVYNIRFKERTGSGLFMPKGSRFFVTLADNLSGLNRASFAVSGYYL